MTTKVIPVCPKCRKPIIDLGGGKDYACPHCLVKLSEILGVSVK